MNSQAVTTATKRAARAARAAVPALPTMDRLDQTHRQVLETLAVLNGLIARLVDQGIDAQVREDARAICTFFQESARKHHADEEALVFPALLRKNDAELTQHVLRLQQDHGWLEEDWLELQPQLSAVAEGYSWYEPESLRQGVEVFEALYRDHIALEESLIYPVARRELGAPG